MNCNNEKLTHQFNNISGYIEKLTKNFDKTNSTVEKLSYQNEKLSSQIKNLRKSISSIGRGLGNNFEIFNAKWFEKYLSLDHPTIKIETNGFFKDRDNMVNDKTEIFEIDIYSSDPLLICEFTTFLEIDEFSKIEKLVRIKNYFKKESKEVKYIYFVTYEIASEIEDQVTNFCNQHKIILIKKKSF